MNAVYDVERLPVAPRSLHELARLRMALSAHETEPILGPEAASRALVTDWVGGASAHGEVLTSLAESMAGPQDRGLVCLLEGPAGVGKTHLLIVLAALAECHTRREELAKSWRLSDEALALINSLPKFLVVPVSLADHRGATDPLEEILFAAAEAEAAKPPFELSIPLSAASYALQAACQHLLPAHAEALDAEARARGFADWDELVAANRRLAAALVRSMAGELGMPAPLTPSRSERLATLLEVLPTGTAALWLLDDLDEFLAAAGPKGAREDLGFLRFLAQRARVCPVYVVATASRSPVRGPEMEDDLRSIADAIFSFAPSDLRPLLATGWTVPEAERHKVLDQAVDKCRCAWDKDAPGAQQVHETYPFCPDALELLETAGWRVTGLGNFALRCLREIAQQLDGRPPWQLVGLADLAGAISQQIVGSAGDQAQEAIDYHRQRAGDLWPREPDIVNQAASALLVAQIAGQVLTPHSLSMILGLDAMGRARLSRREARQLLEALARASPYVSKVRMDGETGYVLTWRLSPDEQARREFDRLRATISPSDRRVEEAALRVLRSADSPWSQFAAGAVVEITWCNAPRFVWAEITDPRVLTEDQLIDVCGRLASPDSPESAALYIGLPFHRRQQLEAWRRLGESVANRPGAEGLALWLPAEAGASDVEALRTLAACWQAEEVAAIGGDALAEHVDRQRTLATAEATSALTRLYMSGQVLSISGLDLDGAALSRQAEGDVAQAVAAAAEAALGRVHPQFPRLAPRRPVRSRRPVDLLYEELVRPGHAKLTEDNALGAWARAVLAPLGLLASDEEEVRITARNSPVARRLLDMMRAGDASPAHETGRPIACAELARLVFKSELGLTPELFELCAAVLCRLGYLLAMDEQQRALVVDALPAPFAAQVKYLARAPALGPTRWQAIGRLLRAIGFHGVIPGDFEGQQEAWDTLVAARQEWLSLIQSVRDGLGELWEQVRQGPEQWVETLEELDAAEQLFSLIDPRAPGPVGLATLADAVGELLEKHASFGALASLLARLRQVADFLADDAEEVIGVFRYLIHPKLQAEPDSDVGIRRRQLLGFIASGEQMVRDFATFRRLQQIFFVTYARRYMAHHNREYRSEGFERCAALLNTPEFRALERLAKLQVDVEHNAEYVRSIVEEALERRCQYSGLDRALRLSPACPQCGLELGQEAEVPSAEAIADIIRQGLGEYTQALSAPEFREQLRKYMAALPRWGDLPARLLEVLNLSGPLTPRQVLGLFSDEVILHLNRVLAGEIIVPRDLSELRRALQGKTLTADEAKRIVLEWLEGAGEDRDGEGELYQFED